MRARRRLPLLLLLLLLLSGCLSEPAEETPAYTLETLPEYSGEPWVYLNDNIPSFPEADMTTQAFERYSQLDYYGRCGAAYANVCLETMPTEERGPIGQVRPTGWQTARYDFVDGEYLYNRCHLLGYQLTGENANELNLITGTRYMNVSGMLPFENEIAGYVRDTGNHVLYRVTPIFEGANLLASGVTMEAWSVEDEGRGVCFSVYAYNVQPGVVIDYATGLNHLAELDPEIYGEKALYILNTGSRKFHLPTCPGVADIKEQNRQEYNGYRQLLLDGGYAPCGSCMP